MKKKMRADAKKPNLRQQIVFPRMHIPTTNSQLRYGLPWLYNGFIIYLPNLVMLVDPGVDILYRLAISNIAISQINTLFVSHGHLDHVGGANVILDWLIRAQQNTEIVAPKAVFRDKEISDFHAGIKTHASGWKSTQFPTIAKAGKPIELTHGDYKLKPIRLHHGVECYGFRITFDSKSIVYISDTGYAKTVQTTEEQFAVGKNDYKGLFVKIKNKHKELRRTIRDCDILIVNIETLEYNKNSKTHLTVYDVIDMVRNNKINKLIVAHINPTGELGEHWVRDITEYIQYSTGTKCYYPTREGLVLML